MKAETRPEQKNLRLLIADQLKILRSKSGRCIWHTAVLDWCTDVYRRNPGAYDHMALGGFLKLPDKDTCRKRAARVQATSGESKELMAKLNKRVAGLPPHRREMALLFDEVNILGDIAFKIIKGQYRFFGFIDAESHPSELYVDTQKEISHADYVKKQVATHALVFQVAELGGEAFPSRLRQVVGMHAVTNLNAVTLNGLFWRTVRNLYLLAGVTIVVNISDGASCNRLFQKMNTHRLGKGTGNIYQSGKAWCINPYIPGHTTKMWFMSDPAHWVKKVVTHWEKSKQGGKPGARYLRIPDHLVQLVLKRCPPPAPHAHQSPERGATVGIEWYCRVLGRCYAIMGGAHQPRFQRLDDPRLQELRDILALVWAWHAYNAARPDLAAAQKAARGFSHQLLWDTQIMIEGFLGLLSDLQVRHGSFIVRVRMLNQDSPESLFGRIRMACGSGNDPTMLKVLQSATRAEDVAVARAGIRNRRTEQNTNSGQAGAVGLPQPGAWIDRHRVVLERRVGRTPQGLDQVLAGCPFKAACEQASQAASAPLDHEVMWQTLRQVQMRDEKRQRAFGRKLMFWLTTSKHINRTGFSRMRVGLAIAVLCGPRDSAMMADVLQLLRYEG
jgi:hypothetical protein